MNKRLAWVLLAIALIAFLAAIATVRFYPRGETVLSEGGPIETTPRATERQPAQTRDSSNALPSTPAIPSDPFLEKLRGLSTDPVERQSQIDELVAKMTTTKRVEFLDRYWSEDATGGHREMVGEVMRKWAEEMPHAAAEWLGRKPPGELHREVSRAVAIIWANRNVTEAANWVRAWAEEEREAGLISVAYEAARGTPRDALWIASELSQTSARDELVAYAVREWASSDATAPVAWAEKMESSPLREQVFAGTAVSLSDTDPVAAANLALEQLPPGNRQEDAVVSIVQRWAQSDPGEAAAWVSQFPEGTLQEAAVENLVQLWTDKNAEQSAAWLNGLEPGPVKDTGLAAYARKLAPEDPKKAISWAEMIANAEARERTVESLLVDWMQTDGEAARAWVQNASLAADSKARLLRAQ